MATFVSNTEPDSVTFRYYAYISSTLSRSLQAVINSYDATGFLAIAEPPLRWAGSPGRSGFFDPATGADSGDGGGGIADGLERCGKVPGGAR